MKIIGINKETKEKVWFDTNWIRLVCEYGEERDYKMFGIGNQFQIDPSDHDWTIENIEDNECVDFLLKLKQIANNVHYYNDAEINCETISEMIKEKINKLKKDRGDG